MSVKNTHRDYDRMAPLWQRCRDAVAGQAAMHAAGKRYLAKLKGEDDEEYKARVARSDFFNASWRTIAGLVGMAFRKPANSELPGLLEGYAQDITMSGTNLDAIAEQIVEEVLEVGRIGLLVDHPAMPGNVSAISRAAAEQVGLRPFLSIYPAESIRNWRYDRIANSWRLRMVVLGEQAEVQKDEFETETVERYRVLDLDEGGFYRQRVFEVREGVDVLIEGPIYPAMNGAPMQEIPFAMIGRSGMGDAIDEPPLIDLIDANIAHYQINADYRHGLHYTALPTLFLSGIAEDEGKPFHIGGSAAITSPHPDAKGMFIEYTGQGLGAISTALKELRQQMSVLGAAMIVEDAKREMTATQSVIEANDENSILARIVIACSEALEWALGIMAQWSGVSGEVVYQINRAFTPAGLSSHDLIAYMSAVQQGLMSEQEFYALLQRGDVVDGTKDFEAHQEEIGQQGPSRPDPLEGIAA